jgi:hypothetical protein
MGYYFTNHQEIYLSIHDCVGFLQTKARLHLGSTTSVSYASFGDIVALDSLLADCE